DLKKESHIGSYDKYKELYLRSIESPEEFWSDVAKEFFWKTKHSGPFLDYNFDVTKGEIFVKCMDGASTNICYNVLDRNVHEKKLGDKVAFYWEGNEPGDELTVTYRELLQRVCQFANVLKSRGVKKGDRVSIYMPMVVELVVAMLACARIGAVHSIVFAGFSSESLCERILDSQCCLLITADGFYRGDKLINLKVLADEALQKCRDKYGFLLQNCIVLKHLSREPRGGSPGSQSPPAKRACPDLQQVPWNPEVDLCWHALVRGASDECDPEWCESEDPLFILYTSGSTGKPKGVLHTVSGYMLYTAATFKLVFDHQPDDVFWCTADIGWITGHSYITYGPLANGATSVLFEGLPTYPDVSRMWEIVDKYQVTKFYTAPTAIRMLMKYGSEPVQKTGRESLKILGTVGEPINPEAWQWYHTVVGEKRCPIVDTFWQTETGGHVLTPLPVATPLKPGSATLPFFGVVPAILNESGEELEGETEGYLVFKQPWPGVMRTVYGNHQRFQTTYFKKFPGYYVTGDGCRRDKDGYYWITGRIDDMLNVSGHLLSTSQVESALVEHEAVAEAAVVGRPHPIKGESLYCFVTLTQGVTYSRALEAELKKQVREKIGAIATPDYIQNAPGLPKTRSGKIMRRVLRKIACDERDLGDISTLADTSVVEELFLNRCSAAV
uniref:Acetyl-coenzyme A synthetase, cytoplasmic n=1 Tax=Tetraodon nigroviridis TaxID=99883 RepID=H3CMY8_TETNG